METRPTSLPGVVHLCPPKFGDARGFFHETFHQERYAAVGVDVPFVQDNHSRSSRGVLRGLHLQLEKPQAKLVWVARGEVLDVAVDLRPDSPHFGQHYGARLSDDNGEQLFMPAGFGHGFLVLSEVADFCYKCSDVYSGAADQHSVRWDDPALGIDWLLDELGQEPLLSDKDRDALPLTEMTERLRQMKL